MIMDYVIKLPPPNHICAKFYDWIPIFITKYINNANNDHGQYSSDEANKQWNTVAKN